MKAGKRDKTGKKRQGSMKEMRPPGGRGGRGAAPGRLPRRAPRRRRPDGSRPAGVARLQALRAPPRLRRAARSSSARSPRRTGAPGRARRPHRTPDREERCTRSAVAPEREPGRPWARAAPGRFRTRPQRRGLAARERRVQLLVDRTMQFAVSATPQRVHHDDHHFLAVLALVPFLPALLRPRDGRRRARAAGRPATEGARARLRRGRRACTAGTQRDLGHLDLLRSGTSRPASSSWASRQSASRSPCKRDWS